MRASAGWPPAPPAPEDPMNARKTPAAWIAGLALLAVPAFAADLPTADEVFARHRAAIGGDAIDKVKNAAYEFSFTMPSMGVATTGKAYQVFPGKSYMMIDLASVGVSNHEEGTSDGVVWQNSPQTGLRTLEGLEKRMALQRTRLDAFSAWKELWQKAETTAEEPVDGEACYKVVLTPAEGERVSGWFSKKSGLLLRMEVPVPQVGASVVVKTSGFRSVDGVMMAHRIDQEGPMPITIEYTRIRFNVDDIPAGRFDLPAGLSAPATR
jgi:hypothetical protein